jgi:hypothetical protein
MWRDGRVLTGRIGPAGFVGRGFLVMFAVGMLIGGISVWSSANQDKHAGAAASSAGQENDAQFRG